MSYARRHIGLTFRLGQGEFGGEGTGFNTVTLPEGLRIQASIKMAGDASQTEATLRIFGIPLEIMNRLSVLGKPLVAGAMNTVEVSVSDDDSPQPTTVFIGTIFQAWGNFQSPPDAVFEVSAQLGIIDALRPLDPTSYKGSVDVALAMESLASKLGHLFKNNGVSVQLSNQYLSGTGRDQMTQLAKAANISWVLDENTVVIWPRGGSRSDVPSANIGPDTGMIGYPVWTDAGIVLQCLYNPALRFGAPVNVTSDIKAAQGEWIIYRVEHELESEMPDGKWFSRLEAFFTRPVSVA